MAGTRNVTAVLQRRQEVAGLYLRGAQQYDIARQLGVSQQQISFDLKAVREMWLASAVRDFDALKAEQLAKIDHVEAEAWGAWVRSQQPREVTLTERTEGEKASHKASVRREGQAGDPRFLERVQKCIDQRCEILGLNAPKKFSFDWDRLNDDQLARLAAGEMPTHVMAEA